MKKNIWQIDEELLEIGRLLDETEGEISDETNARLDALLDQRDDKYERYIDFIGDAQAMTEAAAYKKRKVERTRKKWANLSAKLRRRLEESLVRNEKDKVETAAGTAYFTTRTNTKVQLKGGVEMEDAPLDYVIANPTLDLERAEAVLADPDHEDYERVSAAFEVVTAETTSLTVR